MKGWSQTPLKTINMSQDVFLEEPIYTTGALSPPATRRSADRKLIYLSNRRSSASRYGHQSIPNEEVSEVKVKEVRRVIRNN